MKMTEVEPIVGERILLDDSVGLLWSFMRYNGLLPNFCRNKQENRMCYIARFMITLSAMLFILIYSGFLIWEIIEIARDTVEVLKVIEILYTLVSMLSALFFLIHYLVYRDEFMELFEDWRKMEIEFSSPSTATKRGTMIKLIYVLYLAVLIGQPVTILIWNIMDPNEVFFISSHSNELLSTLFLSSITAFCYYYHVIYYCMGELMPTLFYYHAGCAIENIERELQDAFIFGRLSAGHSTVSVTNVDNQPNRASKLFRGVWKKYETVFQFVKRANKLFAFSIICRHFTWFVLRCLAVYTILKMSNSLDTISKFFTVLNLIELLRAVLVNRLISYLYSSRDLLRDTIAALLSQKWQLLSEDDRNLLIVFQSRLVDGILTISPFNLYTVSPSNLLSMLSLIVTYIIVLLQIDISTTH